MNIQIGVVITQILGFLVIFWILKRYAWGPVLDMLEKRREDIRGTYAKIEELKADAEQLKSKYEADLRKIDAEARQRMNERLAEAQKMAQEIEANARDRAAAELAKIKDEIEREYQAARLRLKEDIVGVALASSERMVRESLDRNRQRRLVEDFLKELDEKSAERKS